ncbi:MAG: MFS transporter, partial [Candidatus Thermoplasmatota archaeon]|nr:MFS transporter [Candidatus Thermoplasmatota archaeon]
TSQDGARATAKYYSGSGKEERWLVKASFFTGITGGVLWYVLIYYWAALGFSSQQIGLMGGLGSAVGVITYIFGGYLADAFGRKKLFLVGLVAEALGCILFVTEKNLAVFTLGYSLTSLGGSLIWPSLMALMAAKTTAVNMKFFYGVQGFVNQIGLTIATFLGIFGPPLLEKDFGIKLSQGFGYVFLITAVCAVIPLFYVMRVKETKKRSEKLTIHFDKRMRGRLYVYCFQNALIGAGAGFVIPWLPIIFNKGLGASDSWVAGIFTLSNAVIAIGWFVVPIFAGYRGSVALITVCQLASCIPLLLIPYSPILLVVALLYTVRSFLMLVPTPVLNAYVMNIVSEQIRASFLAISQLAWQLAFSASYFIAGFLWASNYTKVGPFYITAAFYIVASLIFFAYFRNIKESHDEHAHSQSAPMKT